MTVHAPDQAFRLVLASASPRRRELLAQAGYTFEIAAADVDESPRPGEPAAVYVQRLAEEKARVLLARYVNSAPREEPAPNQSRSSSRQAPLVVLGADTTVDCDGQILGKPADAADAMHMLRMLSGRTHQVLTGLALATPNRIVTAVEATVVTFLKIPESELATYCATAEPMDKAGAYGIQGYAARWIPRIEGCYFNVMGLPIARVVKMIEHAT